LALSGRSRAARFTAGRSRERVTGTGKGLLQVPGIPSARVTQHSVPPLGSQSEVERFLLFTADVVLNREEFN
jgi:hypothetical protein